MITYYSCTWYLADSRSYNAYMVHLPIGHKNVVSLELAEAFKRVKEQQAKDLGVFEYFKFDINPIEISETL